MAVLPDTVTVPMLGAPGRLGLAAKIPCVTAMMMSGDTAAGDEPLRGSDFYTSGQTIGCQRSRASAACDHQSQSVSSDLYADDACSILIDKSDHSAQRPIHLSCACACLRYGPSSGSGV